MPEVDALCNDSTTSNYSFSEDSLCAEGEEGRSCSEEARHGKFRTQRKGTGSSPKAKRPTDRDQNLNHNSTEGRRHKVPRKKGPCGGEQRKDRETETRRGHKSIKKRNREKSRIPKLQAVQIANSEKKITEGSNSKFSLRSDRNVCTKPRENLGKSSKRNEVGFANTQRVIFDVGDGVNILEENKRGASDRYESRIVARLLHRNSEISQATSVKRNIVDERGACDGNVHLLNKRGHRNRDLPVKKKNPPQEKTVKPLPSGNALRHLSKQRRPGIAASQNVGKETEQEVRAKIEIYMPRFEDYVEQPKQQELPPLRKVNRSSLPPRTPEARSKKNPEQKKCTDGIKSYVGHDVNDLKMNLKNLRQKVDALKTKSRRRWSIDPKSLPVLASKEEDTSPERQPVAKNDPKDSNYCDQNETITNTNIDEDNTLVSSKALNSTAIQHVILEPTNVNSESRGGCNNNFLQQKGYSKKPHGTLVHSYVPKPFPPVRVGQNKTEPSTGSSRTASDKVPDEDLSSKTTTKDTSSSSRLKSSTDNMPMNRPQRLRAAGNKSYKQIYEEGKIFKARLEKRKKLWKVADPFAQPQQDSVKLSSLYHAHGSRSTTAHPYGEINDETWLERCHYMQHVKSQQTSASNHSNHQIPTDPESMSSSPRAPPRMQQPRMKSNIPRLPPINESGVFQKPEPPRYQPPNKRYDSKQRYRNFDRIIPP